MKSIFNKACEILNIKKIDKKPSYRKAKEFEFTAFDLVKKWEGLKLVGYLPTPDDVPTVGYGHTKTAEIGQRITEAQAHEFLAEDIKDAENAVKRYVKVKINQNQYDALVSFTFNLGAGALQRSTLLRKLNTGDYEGAANEFGKWIYQGKKVLTGLINRRKEERALFRKPVDE